MFRNHISSASKIQYLAEVISAGVLWGLFSLFVKGLNCQNISPIQILFIKVSFSTIIMFILIMSMERKCLKIHFRDLWMFIGTGVISMTFHSLCYYRMILEVGVSVAVILLYTAPFFVIILSAIFFREKITAVKSIALVLTFGGCIMVSGLGSSTHAIGLRNLIIGLSAGLGYALYSIFSRTAVRKYHPMTITFYTFLFSAITIVPFCNVSEFINGFSIGMVPNCMGLAFLCTVIPYLLYTDGIVGLEAGKAAIFVTVEPLVGTMVGILVFGESANFMKLTGIFMILCSIILIGINHKK
ncbi:MAG: DMT family transporter [Spirochaetia bacterium]|nr:DMT family transporter [Spirochaetia bacterium]